MKHKFHGKAENWKFVPDTPLAFKGAFIELEGKRVTVTVGRERKERSVNENNYFHGVVCQLLSEVSGYDPEEMKGILKFRFGVKHTSELNTVDFENFMAQCRWWAIASEADGGSGLNCYIPLPNEAEGE